MNLHEIPRERIPVRIDDDFKKMLLAMQYENREGFRILVRNNEVEDIQYPSIMGDIRWLPYVRSSWLSVYDIHIRQGMRTVTQFDMEEFKENLYYE